jgi:hypothetical protein
LHGGEEGRKWASDIVKIYLPKKWRVNWHRNRKDI